MTSIRNRKTKEIYGVSSKYDFGKWNHRVCVFGTEKEAEEWLRAEEYDFRERELLTKTEAIKLAGRKAVEDAYLWDIKGIYPW